MDLSTKDQALQQQLFHKVQQQTSSPLGQFNCHNPEIAAAGKSSNSFQPVFNLLEKRGSFEFNVETIDWLDTDGESRQLTINRASKTHMWPMGTHFWVRDNALIASRLLNLDYDQQSYPLEWFQQGKELLLSTLTIISSVAQLKRFNNIIEGKVDASDPHQWPHIFLTIETNLNAAIDEPWMHKQDAWQIIAYCTLEALEKGFIKANELSDKQCSFLKLICPFLKAINFTECMNGGSWEEIEAVRTSVISWETALLNKVRHSDSFGHPDAQALFKQGIDHLSKSLPHESPGYASDAPQYREADASLLYFFLLELDQYLPESQRDELIASTLESIESLVSTHGIKRYQDDPYQGLSYYTNTVSDKLTQLYNSPSGDNSGVEQFIQRGEIVPAGHEAEWSHFVWQLSSVYAQLYQRYQKDSYKEKQTHYFLFGLSLITGNDAHSIQQDDANDQKFMAIMPVPAFQIPECYNSEKCEDSTFHYPSMHTPLYWSIAECLAAFDQIL